MPKNRKRNSQGRALGGLIFLAFVGLVLLIKALTHGHNIALLSPKGFIAHEQRSLIIFTAILLLTVAIPALSLLFFTAWKYRESNTKATHDPDVRHSKFLVPVMWLVPSVFMLVLALVMWPATHRLEPQKQIDNIKPLTIQVISTRWKWLFIYPEQNIATVNFVQVPVDTPVEFELTADEAPMSSFWIPNLSGQLYTMTGMVNRLNLLAGTPGDYPGSSAEINGAGFAEMKFTARASSRDDFDQWMQEVKRSPNVLDTAAYSQLVKPSENNPLAFYSAVEGGLYDNVVMKYMGPLDGHMDHEHHE